MSDAERILDRLRSGPITVEPKPRPTCGTCPYWDEHRSQACRFHAPRATAYGDCIADDHIARQPTDWCGQHPDMAEWIRNEWPKVKANAR